jgi:hypothetical protein
MNLIISLADSRNIWYYFSVSIIVNLSHYSQYYPAENLIVGENKAFPTVEKVMITSPQAHLII